MFKSLVKMFQAEPTAPVDRELEAVKKKYIGIQFLDYGARTATRKILNVGRSKYNEDDFYLVIHATNTDKKYTIALTNFSLKDHTLIK